VEVVGARPRDGVHHRAGAVALGRAVVTGLDAELLKRVGKRERLILLEVRIGMAGAIEPERHLPRLGAVGRQPQRAGNRLPRFLIDRGQHHAGHQRAQLGRVAAVQRQFDNALLIDDLAEDRRRDVDGGRFAGYGHGLRERANLDREIHGEVLVRLQQQTLALRRPEPLQLRGDVVGRRPQRRERVPAVDSAHGVSRQPGRDFLRLDRDARDDRAGVVRDDAVDLSGLCERGTAEQPGEAECEDDPSFHTISPARRAACRGDKTVYTN
jgi:hypothetical protein